MPFEPALAERIVSPVLAHLERLHARYASDVSGQLASYIPELAKADPASFGICVATISGAVYEVGDTRQPFTLQSISKPLTYGLALADLGEAAVRARIGVEPTGDAFNAIALSPGSGIPFNPMVNAGAIAAAGLVDGAVGRTGVRSDRGRLLGLGRPAARRRRVGLPLRARHGPSQPGHRPPAAQHGRPRG